ncbi:MAG: dockerin type I repeat-containing protein, partial [Eubacteriales bacterium]
DGFVPAYTCVGEHTYGEWEAVTDSTATTELKKHTCTVCGYEETIQVGDANGDGTISIADITAILGYLSATEEEQAQLIAERAVIDGALDADGNGSVSISDVTTILDSLASNTAE